MEGENRQGRPENRGRGVMRWVVIGAVIVVCYALSIGPALKILAAGHIGLGAFERAYAPVFLLCDRCKPADDFFDWYLTVWVPD